MEEPDQEAYRQLTSLIKGVDRGLTYEMAHGETWEIAISADGMPELIPTVRAVVEQAPAINGWKVLAFRQASTVPPVITVFDQELTPENVFFSVEGAKDGVSDLVLYMPGIQDETTFDMVGMASTFGLTEQGYFRHMAHCAMLLMEALIGEHAVMTRIGEVEYESSEGMPEGARPLAELPSVVHAVV